METAENIAKLSYPCKIADQEDVLIKWGIENHDEWVITPVGIYGRYKYEDIKKDPWNRPLRKWKWMATPGWSCAENDEPILWESDSGGDWYNYWTTIEGEILQLQAMKNPSQDWIDENHL